MEKFEKNEDEILRAESMMDEISNNRFILNKEDPIDEMSPVRLAAERQGELFKDQEVQQQAQDYIKNVKNIDWHLLTLGKRQEFIDGLYEQIEELKKVPEGKHSQEEINKEIREAQRIISELSKQNDESVMEIEKFASSDKPNLGYEDERDSWKN